MTPLSTLGIQGFLSLWMRKRGKGRNRGNMSEKRTPAFVWVTQIFVTVVAAGFASAAMAQTRAGASSVAAGSEPDLTGVYVLVPKNVTIPGGLKAVGGPEEIGLQPSAQEVMKTRSPKGDLAKLCMPVGPFRMMAWEGNKIDVYRSPGRITMLFENYYLGHMRTIYLDRPHTPGLYWVGDSIGHWDKDTLIVDATGFNNYTWLNDAGAPHSDALHLTERYRQVGGGKYLEVKVTAEDPKVLTKPYTYTRYYEKVNSEIQEFVCWDDLETVGE